MASAFNETLRSSDISVPGAFDISHSLGSDRSRTDSKHRNFDDIAARIFELGLVSRQRAGYAVGARKSASLHLSLNPNLFIEPESRALCVTAIGGGEPSPPSTGGKVWTMTVVMIGWGVLTYTLLALMSYVLEGHLGIAIKMRRMQRQVARTNNHFVLCGYGRVGSEIARDFHRKNIDAVREPAFGQTLRPHQGASAATRPRAAGACNGRDAVRRDDLGVLMSL